jgi:superfamily I DNA and RNA helicase
MGFGEGIPKSKEQQIKELDAIIAVKKAQWKKAEETNYELRNNFSANTEGKPVDFTKLEQRDVSERDKHNAYVDGQKATKQQMERLQAEIDELEEKKRAL